MIDPHGVVMVGDYVGGERAASRVRHITVLACIRAGRRTVTGPRSLGHSRTRRQLMITGLHAIVYAADADRARAFFRDVLELPNVDAGDGWLIFAAPPAELAVHPAGGPSHELYLMCDDVHRTVEELAAKGVEFTAPVTDQGWGLLTSLQIPGGGELGLYEPRHPTAIG